MELSQFFLTFHYFQFVYCPNIKLFKIEKKINFFLLLQRWKCGGNKLQLIFNQVCNSLIECSLKIVEQSLKLPGESGSRRSEEGCQPKMILFQIILFTLLKRGFEGRSVSSQGNYSFNLNIPQINNTKFLVVGCRGSGGVISKKPLFKKEGRVRITKVSVKPLTCQFVFISCFYYFGNIKILLSLIRRK